MWDTKAKALVAIVYGDGQTKKFSAKVDPEALVEDFVTDFFYLVNEGRAVDYDWRVEVDGERRTANERLLDPLWYVGAEPEIKIFTRAPYPSEPSTT